MANVYAVKTGNWSDTTVWNTGQLPTSSDDVYANGYSVTIDTNVSVRSIRTFDAYMGGYFAIDSSKTVSCSYGFYIYSYGFFVNMAIGRTVNLIGNIVSYYGNGRSMIFTGQNGTVNITGDIISLASTAILEDGNSTTFNITGNIYGSSGTYGQGFDFQYSRQFVYITGNLYAGTNSSAVTNSAGLIGNSSIVSQIGACYAQNNVPALTGDASVTMTLTGPFYTSVNGTHAVFSPNWKWLNGSPSPTFYQIRTADLSSIVPLYTATYVGGNPATTNVRSGTIYGPNSELTGTCAVPHPNSVAYGVPTDNTTGVAVLTESAVKSGCSKAVVPALLALG